MILTKSPVKEIVKLGTGIQKGTCLVNGVTCLVKAGSEFSVIKHIVQTRNRGEKIRR